MSNPIGAIVLCASIAYIALKLKQQKELKTMTENKVSLISDTKLSKEINNKNDNSVQRPKSLLYPSSSRLRYNKRRFLGPIML